MQDREIHQSPSAVPSRGLSRSPLARCTLMLLLAGAGTAAAGVAAAQNQDQAAEGYVKICSSVTGAACIEEPGPATPVPEQFQASYQAYVEMQRKAHGGRKLTWDDKPDWSGIWNHAGGFAWAPETNRLASGAGEDSAQAILDHCGRFPCEGWVSAALTPPYALRYRQKLTAVAHGFEWDQLSDCLPAGFPRFLLEPVLKRFIVTPDKTIWINEWQSETRYLFTDGRGHVPQDDAIALWEGDSIGFWDGDTLVVHTIRMKPEELQRNQPGISDEASTVERIKMIDPNTIEDDVTLWDPKALEKPWRGMQKYTRVTTRGLRMDMYSCEENNNVIQTAHGGSTFILPGETVTVQRHYRDPDNFQNANLDRAIAYGAELMKKEQAGAEGDKKAD
ncbi:MAG TPA: hypothetical protein VFY39_04080 [Gammaproteobacteria bacterium]|nr:hypothetical protein [Gammaproteobacteria bacterium]